MVNTYSNLQNSNFYNIFYYLLLRKKGFYVVITMTGWKTTDQSFKGNKP